MKLKIYPYVVITRQHYEWEIFNIATRDIARRSEHRDAIALASCWAEEIKGSVYDLSERAQQINER